MYIFFAYLGLLISKIFLVQVIFGKDKFYIRPLLNNPIFTYLVIPFYSLFLNHKRFNLLDKKELKNFRIYSILSEILGVITYICTLKFLLDYSFANFYESVIIWIIFFTVSTLFLYLSVYDLVTFSIPTKISRILLIVILFSNLIVGIIRYIGLNSNPLSSYLNFGNIELGYFTNLLGGLVLGGIILFLVKITKERGMGMGDVEVMASIGFLVGLKSALISFYWTLILGSVIGIGYSLIVKKFKGVQIPFVPIIMLGYLVVLFSGNWILSLFMLTV